MLAILDSRDAQSVLGGLFLVSNACPTCGRLPVGLVFCNPGVGMGVLASSSPACSAFCTRQAAEKKHKEGRMGEHKHKFAAFNPFGAAGGGGRRRGGGGQPSSQGKKGRGRTAGAPLEKGPRSTSSQLAAILAKLASKVPPSVIDKALGEPLGTSPPLLDDSTSWVCTVRVRQRPTVWPTMMQRHSELNCCCLSLGPVCAEEGD